MRQALLTVHTEAKRRVSMLNRMRPGYSCSFVTQPCPGGSSSRSGCIGAGANKSPHANALRLLAFLMCLHWVLFLPSFVFFVCVDSSVEVPVGLLHV